MKENIKPATGRLGVLGVGVGGAVATTMITGTSVSYTHLDVYKRQSLSWLKIHSIIKLFRLYIGCSDAFWSVVSLYNGRCV